MRRSAERAAALLAAAAALLLAACAPGNVETAFAYGEPIAIGPATLQVVRAETVPRNAPPLNSLHPAEGQQAAAVFVRWSGLDGLSDPGSGFRCRSGTWRPPGSGSSNPRTPRC
jgi:hypothetical protein